MGSDLETLSSFECDFADGADIDGGSEAAALGSVVSSGVADL